MKYRTVEQFLNWEWVPIAFEDIKAGMRVRLFESDGTPQMNGNIYLVASDAEPIANENGVYESNYVFRTSETIQPVDFNIINNVGSSPVQGKDAVLTLPDDTECEPVDENDITVLPTLDVKPYDPWSDTIEIAGTKYSAHIFRTLGCGFPDMIGNVIRIDKKENGCVTVTTIYRNDEDGQLEENAV